MPQQFLGCMPTNGSFLVHGNCRCYQLLELKSEKWSKFTLHQTRFVQYPSKLVGFWRKTKIFFGFSVELDNTTYKQQLFLRICSARQLLGRPVLREMFTISNELQGSSISSKI